MYEERGVLGTSYSLLLYTFVWTPATILVADVALPHPLPLHPPASGPPRGSLDPGSRVLGTLFLTSAVKGSVLRKFPKVSVIRCHESLSTFLDTGKSCQSQRLWNASQSLPLGDLGGNRGLVWGSGLCLLFSTSAAVVGKSQALWGCSLLLGVYQLTPAKEI